MIHDKTTFDNVTQEKVAACAGVDYSEDKKYQNPILNKRFTDYITAV